MTAPDDGLWDKSLVFVAILGALFFGTAVYAFVWARRQRQFKDFETSARSIFNDEEPEGEVTDRFPDEANPPAGRDSTTAGDAKTHNR